MAQVCKTVRRPNPLRQPIRSNKQYLFPGAAISKHQHESQSPGEAAYKTRCLMLAGYVSSGLNGSQQLDGDLREKIKINIDIDSRG